jgi:predicted Ser/Thr protein kinase
VTGPRNAAEDAGAGRHGRLIQWPLTKMGGKLSEALRFGRFEVRQVLGRGGMGTVYEAVDPVIGRVVAIKEIRLDSVRDVRERKEMEERFRLEFRTAGTLSHPNVVTVYDVGETSGGTFIAMEHVEGRSLADYLQAEPRPTVERVLDLAAGIASGLDFAHQHGIVHRDVKPANVLLTRDMRPKLSDFGLVKLASAELTTTGMLLGTPAFMAPEQVMGLAVGPASDQFSFAVMLYGMLTGVMPFRAEHPSAILYKIVHEVPDPPVRANPGLPPGVDAVLMRGLAKKPEDRYPTCTELVDDLRRAFYGATGALPLRPAGGGASAVTGFEPTLPLSAVRPPSGPPAVEHFEAGPTLITRRTQIERRSRGLLVAGVVGAVLLLAAAGGFVLSRRGSPPPAPAPAPPAAQAPAPAPAKVVPAAPALVELEVSSQPAGAAIAVDGRETGQKTPAKISIEEAGKAELRLRLDGYEQLVHQLQPAELAAARKDGKPLHFPLKASIPPGILAIEGADYPLQVEIGGRRQSLGDKRELRLPPGRYEAVLVAESVFLRQTYPVEIGSGERQVIRAPQAFAVKIAANPANCRVSIDGRFVDVIPINDRRLVVGSHTFEFNWPAHQKTKTLAVVVARNDQRIFASLDD